MLYNCRFAVTLYKLKMSTICSEYKVLSIVIVSVAILTYRQVN